MWGLNSKDSTNKRHATAQLGHAQGDSVKLALPNAVVPSEATSPGTISGMYCIVSPVHGPTATQGPEY